MVLDRAQIHLFIRGERDLLLMPRQPEQARAPHQAGSTIALQPAPGREATCRVAVVRETDVALGELDDQDARRLGHRDLDDLMGSWVERHGLWNENARAWRLEVKVDPSAPPRFLRPQSRRIMVQGEDALQYTSDEREAMADEPEAVDDVALAASRRAAHDAEHTRFERLVAERRRLPLHERVRLALADAERLGVRCRSEHDLIARAIGDVERRVLRPVDRTRDEDVPTVKIERTRRPPRPVGEIEKAARERRKPRPVSTRVVDPELVPKGSRVPRDEPS